MLFSLAATRGGRNIIKVVMFKNKSVFKLITYNQTVKISAQKHQDQNIKRQTAQLLAHIKADTDKSTQRAKSILGAKLYLFFCFVFFHFAKTVVRCFEFGATIVMPTMSAKRTLRFQPAPACVASNFIAGSNMKSYVVDGQRAKPVRAGRRFKRGAPRGLLPPPLQRPGKNWKRSWHGSAGSTV